MSLIEVGTAERFITTVTINRPEKRNALNLEMYRELPRLFAELGADDAIRVIILQGKGDIFSAGADMKELAQLRRAGQFDPIEYWRVVTTAHISLAKTPKAVIAKIGRGGAMGAGCALAVWCDFRIADERAQFGIPAPQRMGINLGRIDTARILVSFGAARARELLMLADNLTAEEAFQKGLINWVARKDTLDDLTLEKATRISKNAPLAVATGKMNIEAAIKGLRLPENPEEVPWHNSLDAELGIEAFLNRQPVPDYKGV